MNPTQTVTLIGLGTTDVLITQDGTYTLDCKLSHSMLCQDVSQPAPPASGGTAPSPESDVVVTINLNSDPAIYTGEPGATGFNVKLICVTGDVVHIDLSSSASADQGANVVKGVVSVF